MSLVSVQFMNHGPLIHYAISTVPCLWGFARNEFSLKHMPLLIPFLAWYAIPIFIINSNLLNDMKVLTRFLFVTPMVLAKLWEACQPSWHFRIIFNYANSIIQQVTYSHRNLRWNKRPGSVDFPLWNDAWLTSNNL